jgi:hypothetical protein
MSATGRNCFYIDSHNEAWPAPTGHEYLQAKERAIVVGFSWLTRLAKGNGLIAFDQIQNADNTSRVLKLLMPGKTFDQFKKGETVKVGAVSVTIVTKKKCPPTWDGPVLVIYPSGDLLSDVDGIEGVTDVMVVPWQPLDKDAPVAAWIARESATPLVPQA